MEYEKSTDLEFWEKLDVVGEDQVRDNVDKNIYGTSGIKRELVDEWLRHKEEITALEASAKHDIFETETLSIAKEAIFIANSAARKTRIYGVITVMAIIISIFAAYDKIILLFN